MKCKPWIRHFQPRKFQCFSSQFALQGLRALENWPFFTQISGRNFLPELCGEIHPRTAPLQALHCALCSTEQSTSRGRKNGENVPRKGEEEGWPAKGAKRKNHFVLIDVCSVDLRVACVRLSTRFKGVSLRETHLWEHFGWADKIALITCLKNLNVSSAFLIRGQKRNWNRSDSNRCDLKSPAGRIWNR